MVNVIQSLNLLNGFFINIADCGCEYREEYNSQGYQRICKGQHAPAVKMETFVILCEKLPNKKCKFYVAKKDSQDYNVFLMRSYVAHTFEAPSMHDAVKIASDEAFLAVMYAKHES